VVYAAAKAALNSMTMSVSEELATRGVTVNTVGVGPIDLEPEGEGEGEKDRSVPMERVKDDPVGWRVHALQHTRRKGTPEDVAGAILWLCNPGSGFVTGQVTYVDGGIHLPLG